MTIKSLYPASRPALGLDFAKTKRLDPRVTFTRASTGTFVGDDGFIQTAASGVPRFNHNGATGESLGLLIEGAMTNYILNSSVFTNAGFWQGNQGITISPNQALAPDGITFNGTLIQQDTSTSLHQLSKGTFGQQLFTTSSNYTISVFVKRFNANRITLCESHHYGLGGYTKAGMVWDFSTESIVRTFQWGDSSQSRIAGTSVTKHPNGWYRISLAVTPGGDSNNQYVFPALVIGDSGDPNGFGRSAFVGNGVDGVYIWGFQTEIGTFSTSYIPTTTATVTRAADVATLSNANSSIFPTSAFTTVNTPFGTAGGGSTVKLVGPTIKRTAIYAGDLPQAQINALAGVNDNFWRWRVLGSSFALPNFTTDGSVTVDWGDGTVQTLTTAVRTFANGNGYHDIGFRLNSGTFFKPNINNNATYKDRVIAVGPAPASMKIAANFAFDNCTNLRGFDGTVDVSGSTNLSSAWDRCSSLASFPLINTADVTSMGTTWRFCSSLTSFPLINTSNVTGFGTTWQGCVGLKSFPLIDTSKAVDFSNAWFGCSGLTSFPLLNSSKVTNFTQTWDGCNGLLSFPALDTNKGTTFAQTWRSCAFASFPFINTSSATTFQNAWNSCSNLATFPANMFDTTGTLVATAFVNTFNNCALTAASIENILTSLVTNGQSNNTLTLTGGTNAGAAAWTTAANTAYATLISRGWTITRNA